ncbi:PaaI family thioesterase [Rhodococcus sp. BE178]|uniref:PaaI family thioesterase n=1 Tax=Rhodococcus sp. BE178 TaxID=2817737 RepID=UPI003D214D36
MAQSLRELIDEVVCTDAPTEVIDQATSSIREALAKLDGFRRPADRIESDDALRPGVPVNSAAMGSTNPLAPQVEIETTAEEVIAHFILRQAYEGLPGFAHGGVTSLLFDELLGRAVEAGGRWGMTVDLTVEYLEPVPLQTPLVMRGRIGTLGKRSTTAFGTLGPADDLTITYAKARGAFVQPRVHVLRTYFAGLTDTRGRSVTDIFDT